MGNYGHSSGEKRGSAPAALCSGDRTASGHGGVTSSAMQHTGQFFSVPCRSVPPGTIESQKPPREKGKKSRNSTGKFPCFRPVPQKHQMWVSVEKIVHKPAANSVERFFRHGRTGKTF